MTPRDIPLIIGEGRQANSTRQSWEPGGSKQRGIGESYHRDLEGLL